MNIYEFRESSGNFVVAQASGVSQQGVCWDGTNFYTTDSSTLRKYTIGGTLLWSVTTTSNGTVHHNNDLTYDPINNRLVIAVNNFNVDPNNPNSYLQIYDPSDGSYEGEVQSSSTIRISAVDFDPEDEVILCAGGQDWEIQKRDPNNNYALLDTTTVTGIPLDNYGSYHRTNGMIIRGNQIFLNQHEGQIGNNNSKAPCMVLVCEYDRANFEVTLDNMAFRPYSCTQGLTNYVDGQIAFIRRSADDVYEIPGFNVSSAVIITEPVIYDGRDKVVASRSEETVIIRTSTSYGEIDGSGSTLKCRKWDIVKVVASGNWWNSGGGNIRVRIRVSSTSPSSSVEEIGDFSSGMRTNRDGPLDSDGESHSTYKYYCIMADGEYKFNLEWRKNNGGTGYSRDRNTTAQIVGRASNWLGGE